MEIFARKEELEASSPEKPKQIPDWMEFNGKRYIVLTEEEANYIVSNIQHEYLNKDTYYFSSKLFSRMQNFVDNKDELAGRNSSTT